MLPVKCSFDDLIVRIMSIYRYIHKHYNIPLAMCNCKMSLQTFFATCREVANLQFVQLSIPTVTFIHVHVNQLAKVQCLASDMSKGNVACIKIENRKLCSCPVS